MKVSDNFSIQEFVPPDIYATYGENSIWFVSFLSVEMAEGFRNWFDKPVFINTWALENSPIGQQYAYSGFRPPECNVGAKLSQHRFGRAIDIKIPGIDPEEIRQEIRDNHEKFREFGVSTIEKDTPTWVHVDCRARATLDLYEVPYK